MQYEDVRLNDKHVPADPGFSSLQPSWKREISGKLNMACLFITHIPVFIKPPNFIEHILIRATIDFKPQNGWFKTQEKKTTTSFLNFGLYTMIVFSTCTKWLFSQKEYIFLFFSKSFFESYPTPSSLSQVPKKWQQRYRT